MASYRLAGLDPHLPPTVRPVDLAERFAIDNGSVNALLTLMHGMQHPFFRFNRMGELSVFCPARAP